MLSCDRVCFRDLVVLCVVLEISYLLKLCCRFRFVEDVQSTVLELREELGCGVFVGWWWAVVVGGCSECVLPCCVGFVWLVGLGVE